MQPILVIINPCAGMRMGMRQLPNILKIFCDKGYLPTVYMTQKQGDAKHFLERVKEQFSRIVCIGGDGTFNEVVAGMIENDLTSIPLGYIPAGSTNDFAKSLRLSSNLLQAATDIVSHTGEPIKFDVGSFNGRIFTYVASFGAFTKASYSTSQNVKNALGHLAYILEGIKDLPSISTVHLSIDTDTQTFDGEYLFGAISNSTSLGGLLKLDESNVDMGDGRLELLLIEAPKTPLELMQMIHNLNVKKYDSERISFCSTSHLTIRAPKHMSWTLDGEREYGKERIGVQNLHHAITLIVPTKPTSQNFPVSAKISSDTSKDSSI